MKYLPILIYGIVIFLKFSPKHWFNFKIYVLTNIKHLFHNNLKITSKISNILHNTMYNNNAYFYVEVNKELQTFIETNCTYYSYLNEQLKKDFLKRVQSFINDKQFKAYENCSFGNIEIFTIAYHAVILSFGLKHYLFDEFDEIFIGENSLPNTNYNKKIAGLTSTQGYMFFSKNAIIDGLKNPKDGYNILFHEFAHGLCIQAMLSGEDILNDSLFKRWMKSCSNYLDEIEQGKKIFLREYAFTNYQEFFAVSVESFFERSEEYVSSFPEHYQNMCTLLNQNTIHTGNPIIQNRTTYN